MHLMNYKVIKHSIEHYDPILSLNDSNHIITRIDNEANLISSESEFIIQYNE